MKIFKNPELRGILALLLIILLIGGVMAATSGKLEQWFGITLFSGPRLEDKIVFVSERGGVKSIYVMDKDGSNQKSLTKDINVLSSPAISPLGNRIAFVAMKEKDKQIFSVGGNGGSLEQLTSATGPKKQPAFTPDGKHLSFIASGKVYVGEINGDDPSPILPTDEEMHEAMSSTSQQREIPAYDAYAWAPDSESIAGSTKAANDIDMLVYIPKHDHSSEEANGAGGCPQRQVWPVGHLIGFACAAESQVIVATVEAGKKNALMVFDMDQQRQGTVADFDKQRFGAPTVSPDGTVIVVPVMSLDKKHPSGLLKLDLSSGKGGILAKGEFESPIFSADGNQVLAVSVHDGDKRDIVLIDLFDGEVTQLTKDGVSSDPIWTPVSKK